MKDKILAALSAGWGASKKAFYVALLSFAGAFAGAIGIGAVVSPDTIVQLLSKLLGL
jgi:hypothetical protein